MKKLEIVREAVAIAASFGTAGIVGTAAKTFAPRHTTLHRVLSAFGAYGISGLAAGAVYKSTKQEFDDIVEVVRKAITSKD